MNYAEALAIKLRPRPENGPVVLDLFAGCGGLSLGFEAAGFLVTGIESAKDACATYSESLRGTCSHRVLSMRSALPSCEVIIGGPPCQPFSSNGSQLGSKDSRNGFEIFISAVQRKRPRMWLLENVRGLLGRSRPYFDEVLRRLEELGYVVEPRLLNALHYGVPQNRERVIVVGWRDGRFIWPRRSGQRVTAGEALGNLAIQVPSNSRFLSRSMEKYVASYEKASCCANPRDLRLDAPARTLTCRNLAGATGDMHRLRLSDGRRRMLTVREAARLQGFPDWFEWKGSESSALTQIGNAVPPPLALRLARAFARHLRLVYAPPVRDLIRIKRK